MEVTATDITDVKLVMPRRFEDQRGFFSEVYNEKTFADAGIDVRFVQDNHSRSLKRGTVRGLHFQVPPYAQDKLVRVVGGAIFDVAVDLRRHSPTYGQHVTAEISAKKWNQILVPKGFAHGFMTLEPNTEVIYKVSDSYAPDHDQGLRWNDPDLNIAWPLGEDEAVLSAKDKQQPFWRDFTTPFR